MQDFTHFNAQGRAKMVDVGDKPATVRTAVAAGRVTVNENTFALIKNGGMKKGDVLAVAQVAGIMAAKHTPDIIPMCHPVLIDGIDISLTLDEARLSVEITASASCAGHTGVEGGQRRRAHGIRHVQGSAEGHSHLRHSPAGKDRRRSRRLFLRRQITGAQGVFFYFFLQRQVS